MCSGPARLDKDLPFKRMKRKMTQSHQSPPMGWILLWASSSMSSPDLPNSTKETSQLPFQGTEPPRLRAAVPRLVRHGICRGSQCAALPPGTHQPQQSASAEPQRPPPRVQLLAGAVGNTDGAANTTPPHDLGDRGSRQHPLRHLLENDRLGTADQRPGTPVRPSSLLPRLLQGFLLPQVSAPSIHHGLCCQHNLFLITNEKSFN